MIIRSRMDGEFSGTDNEAVFRLQNGQVWQQVGYRYRYRYLYASRVEIDTSGSRGTMTVVGFSEPIKVRRVA